MIPKIIHYAWFGKNKMSEEVKQCIESWHKFCPDYEIKLWTEDNYDINKCKYMNDAYINKKWAFVSDYFRLDILYQHGGIYLDTDVELLKNLDQLLHLELFMGIESIREGTSINIALGLGFGSIPNHPLVKAMRDDYHKINFVLPNGKLNLTPCPQIQTPLLQKYGVCLINKKQEFNNFTIFPTEYFCPMNYNTGEMVITENTYSIHHYHTSWGSELRKYEIRERRLLINKYKSQFLIKIVARLRVYKKYHGNKFLIKIVEDLFKN